MTFPPPPPSIENEQKKNKNDRKKKHLHTLHYNCFFITKVSYNYPICFNENTMEIVWKWKLWTDRLSVLEICINMSILFNIQIGKYLIDK